MCSIPHHYGVEFGYVESDMKVLGLWVNQTSYFNACIIYYYVTPEFDWGP